MAERRGRVVEGEIAAWRDATRRRDHADPGSTERTDADADVERHHAEYERLTGEAREEQRESERRKARWGEPTSN